MTDVGAGTEIIGRAAELRRVRDAISGDRAIVVTGEAGIGKTTLIRTATDTAGRRRFEGGGFATLAWMPYLALSRATGIDPDGDVDWIARSVERVVGPEVLFVDDLQWVDAGTLAVLERLIGRIALVMASRTDDPIGLAAMDAMTAAGAEQVGLAALRLDEAALLARRIGPTIPATQARRIAERAGGNPLLVEQLTMAGETTSLRLAVAARLRGLTPAERTAVGLLALAERPLDAAALGPAGERLAARGFAIASPAGVVVRHALLAEAVIGDLDEATRRSLHERLSAVVESPGERARHLAAAGDRSGAHAAALDAVSAATTTGERAAHLGLAAATADGTAADRLRIDAAAALRIAGDLDGAMSLLDAVSTTDPELRAHAEAIRARVRWSSGDPEGMRDAIARGLALVGDGMSVAASMLRAEAVVITALVDGRFDEGLREADAAVDLARRTGADVTRPLLVRATILAGLGRDGWDLALGMVVDAARTQGDTETELSAANNLVAGHEMHGDPVAGRTLAVAMVDRAHELRLAGWERQFSAMLANLDLHAGDLAATVERTAALLEEPLDPLAAQQVGLANACALVDLGRAEEASAILDRLLAAAPADPVGRCGILHIAAEQALWAGRPAVALRRVEEFHALGALDHPTTHLVDVTAAWAAIDADLPIPDRAAASEPEGMLIGAARERAAIERLSVTPDATTADAFDSAADAYAGYHRRGELRARWAAAESRRRAGLDEEARAALAALETIVESQGFIPLAGRVRRSLRLLGVRRSTRATADPAERSRSRLTQREREISRLVAAGASNVEIARRLGLGRPTVARLLSSAMDKLGVDSRAQVAATVDVV